MNTTSINQQIAAFRALSTEAAITPEVLGVILQALADLISSAATNTDLQSLSAWKANIQKLSTLLQSISVGTTDTADGLMSKEDKKTLSATSTDMMNLYNMILTLSERVSDVEKKLKSMITN